MTKIDINLSNNNDEIYDINEIYNIDDNINNNYNPEFIKNNNDDEEYNYKNINLKYHYCDD